MRFSNFEITKREILFSTIILCVLVGVGIIISNAISSRLWEKNLDVFSAVKIDNKPDEFDYVIRTDAGNFLAHGTIKAIDPVSLKDIKGSYLEIRKVKEVYTMHTETYTTTDEKGNTQTHTRHYWSWDYSGEENFVAKTVSFLGKKIQTNRISFYKTLEHNATIAAGMDTRYVYYTYPATKAGVMYGKTNEKKLKDLEFTPDVSIERFLEELEAKTKFAIAGFWIGWSIFTIGIIFLFYYIDNRWLEDKKKGFNFY